MSERRLLRIVVALFSAEQKRLSVETHLVLQAIDWGIRYLMKKRSEYETEVPKATHPGAVSKRGFVAPHSHRAGSAVELTDRYAERTAAASAKFSTTAWDTVVLDDGQRLSDVPHIQALNLGERFERDGVVVMSDNVTKIVHGRLLKRAYQSCSPADPYMPLGQCIRARDQEQWLKEALAEADSLRSKVCDIVETRHD